VSAFTVGQTAITPTGDLKPGDDITVSFVVTFDSTFPIENSLQLQTDLGTNSNPAKWTTTLVLDGVSNPRPGQSGKNIYIGGWDLSYAKGKETALQVTLEGLVPSLTSSQNITLMKVQELNSNNQPISGSARTESRFIISSAEVSQNLADRQARIAQFRKDIDAKAAIDVDVSDAEAKYSAAKIAIDSAQSASASQFSAALKNLNDASTLITDGETLLNKAWAQKAITDAQSPLSKVDDLITYFKVNRSMSNDPRISPIIATKESASQYLSSANDLFNQGNYDQARIKASQAFDKGNQSYTDALALKQAIGEASNPLDVVTKPLGANWKYILIGVGVILVIAGIIYWRSRSGWDELG
jgi:hypothetical protein